MRRLPLLVLGLVGMAALFSGCETVPAQAIQVQRTQATLQATKDRIWPLIVAEIGLGYPVRAIEKESGLITTDWVNLPAGYNNMNAAQWVIVPSLFLATWDGLRMNMKVMAVETEPGKTQVTMNFHYEAFENNVQKAWIPMDSNGSVESQILDRIEKRIASMPALAAVEVPEAPKPTAPSAKSVGDSLLELKKLFDAGAITPAEYEAKRKVLVEKL